MYLCSHCWCEKCKCGNEEYVNIDDEMVEIIVKLNKKGYITRNCCARHMQHKWGIPQPMAIYIQFCAKYQLSKNSTWFYFRRTGNGNRNS